MDENQTQTLTEEESKRQIWPTDLHSLRLLEPPQNLYRKSSTGVVYWSDHLYRCTLPPAASVCVDAVLVQSVQAESYLLVLMAGVSEILRNDR